MHTRWSTRRRTHSHSGHASSSAGSHLGPSEAGQRIGLSEGRRETRKQSIGYLTSPSEAGFDLPRSRRVSCKYPDCGQDGAQTLRPQMALLIC